MKAYIIHHESCLDRKDIVQDLQRKTGADIVPACWFPNPVLGCLASHLKVASQALKDAPTKPYLVFEDDCILLEDIDIILNSFPEADVIYLGYNSSDSSCNRIYGTHALYISPKARDVLLSTTSWTGDPYDWELCRICRESSLRVVKPEESKREAFAVQKKGLVSTITHKKRE